MPITLGPNIAALRAQLGLRKSSDELARVFERLASGQRITRAADDPAGLALASSLKADTRIYSQALRNVSDGISLLNIAESGVRALSDIVTRVKELSTQAANGTYSSSQRAALDAEAQALAEEYNRIIDTTSFNGRMLLDGSLGTLSIQAGKGSSGVISFGVGSELTSQVGAGTFAAAFTIASGIRGDMLQTGDLNGDGAADLVLGVQGDSFSVLLGNDDGTFKAVVVYAGSTGNKGLTSELTLGDLNGDGALDLITHNSYDNTVSVLLGNGNGSFKAQTVYNAGAVATRSVMGDINEDGYQDLLVGSNSNPVLLLGNVDGSLKAASVLTMGSSSRHVQLADVTGDGNLDVISPDPSGHVFLRFGNGNGTFAAAVSFSTTTPSDAGIIGDVNGDGALDVLNVMPGSSLVGVYLGNGNGTFKAGLGFTAPGLITPIRVALVDLNGDHALDLAYNDRNSDALIVHLGNGDGSFAAYTSFATASTGPRSMVAADFNGDDVIDLVSSGSADITINVLFGEARDVQRFPEIDLTTTSGAFDAMDDMDALQYNIGSELGNIGAQQSRLEFAARHLAGLRDNFAAAESRISDADIAQDVATMIRLQILQQAAAAVQAHALQGNSSLIERLLSG